MTLISILLSLAADKFLPKLQEFRQFSWFAGFNAWLRNQLGQRSNGALGVLLVVGLPVLSVAVAFYLLGKASILLGFVFGVAVLLYSLGPKDLDAEVQAYIDAREAGNTDAAHQAATDILHKEISGSAFQLTRAITESILVQANERVLAVLFWFCVLGPIGAALYRLSSVLRNLSSKEHEENEFAQAAQRLHAILDWVPARLSALGYAVTGSFVDAVANWRSSASNWAGRWEDSSVGVLLASGTGALQLDIEHLVNVGLESDVQVEVAQVKSAQALVWRTLVVWVLITALMTLAGWAG